MTNISPTSISKETPVATERANEVPETKTTEPPKVMEVRLHGRGGQGGVTCAKILAAVHARLGASVQTFGDYAGERSGAPVRAFTRVSSGPIVNRNKVYEPDHLLVLDSTLLGDDVIAGLAPGGTLVIDSPQHPDEFAERFGEFRIATVDATSIAKAHGIGTRSVVIVNTTIAGAYVRAMGIDFSVLEDSYRSLGFSSNLESARQAWEAARIREARTVEPRPVAKALRRRPVLPLPAHRESPPTGLRTGSWRTQEPKYVQALAPCSAFCPAGNDVIGFVQQVVRDGVKVAASTLGATNPLAATCGRICPAPCMDGCNRREYDGSVNIRGLERWIADQAPVAHTNPVRAEKPARVAIVGGGPAGLSAAYVLALAGHDATIIEGEAQLGGVLRTGIPTYRLPRGVLDQEIDNIVRLGVKVKCGAFLDREQLAGLADDFDAVILALGLQKLRSAGVPGEELEGVMQGISYLHRVNLGGGAPLSGHVVVLGGGNTAMDCARSALRSGASSVTVAYRRTRGEMPAIAEEVDEAVEEGIELLFQRQPVAIHGNGSVAELELAKVVMGEPDESGRRRPIVTDETERLACSTVLLALGQSADFSLLPSGWELDAGRVGLGVGDAVEPLNIFAAGDLSTGDGTVTHAIGDGRRAAQRALAALGEDIVPFERPDRTTAVPSTDIRFDHFARSKPARAKHAAPEVRASDFNEVTHGLSDCDEAHRCFSCGECTRCDTCLVYCPEGSVYRQKTDYRVDYEYCKGCGICVAECPRGAMEMVPTCPTS